MDKELFFILSRWPNCTNFYSVNIPSLHSFAVFQSSTAEVLSSGLKLVKAYSDITWLPGKPLPVSEGIKSLNFLHPLLIFPKTLSTLLCLSLILRQKLFTISRDWPFHSAGRRLFSYCFLIFASLTCKLPILHHFTCNTTASLMHKTLSKLAEDGIVTFSASAECTSI